MGRRRQFVESNMSTGRRFAPLAAQWGSDVLDANGGRDHDDDTAPLVGRVLPGGDEVRSWRRLRGQSAATSAARGTSVADARRSDEPSARPTRRA